MLSFFYISHYSNPQKVLLESVILCICIKPKAQVLRVGAVISEKNVLHFYLYRNYNAT